MYTLMLMIEGQTQHAVLQFTDLMRAKDALEATSRRDSGLAYTRDEWPVLTDDFGRTVPFDPAKLVMVILQDVEKALEGDRAAKMAQIKSDATLQKLAASDPIVKSAQMMMQMAQGQGFRA